MTAEVDCIRLLGQRQALPVLLLEGDSHVFEVDHPYSASSPLQREPLE